MKTTILGHQYVWDLQKGFPVRNSEQKYKMPAAIRNGNSEFFVHMDLVQPKANPIDEAIAHCHNVHDKRRRRYIDGTISDPTAPHILRVRTIEPGEGIEHELCDYAKETTLSSLYAFQNLIGEKKIEDQLTNPHELLKISYDELSMRDRAAVLYLDPDKASADDGVCSFEAYELYAREKIYEDNSDDSSMSVDYDKPPTMRNVTSYPVNYPKEFMPEEYFENRKRPQVVRKRPRVVQQGQVVRKRPRVEEQSQVRSEERE